MPIDRSGEITLSIYADGPSAMYSDLRPSWPTRDSTFDRSRRNTKRRDHNDLFAFVAISTPSTARERRRRRPPAVAELAAAQLELAAAMDLGGWAAVAEDPRLGI